MPGDSLHINNKAVKQNSYDAIVIGSGISGGWAAKELCEKGLKVLMLERGRMVQHVKDYPTALKETWEFPHYNQLTTDEKEKFPIQTRHFSFREDNKHFYIDDLKNPYVETQRYDWIRGDVVGGRSLLWGRASYRWSDVEFESNLKDGHAIDWPIRYKDIAPWYSYVERFIGVSGNRDGLQHLPDGEFQPAFEINAAERYMKSKIESLFKNRYAVHGRVANLTQPVKGRGQCMARNLCHRGCPFGAYFSTNASTMPAAQATGNLTVRPYSLVYKILYDEQKQRASGVEIIDTQTMKTETFYAKIIFLNASTVATSAILLQSTSNRFPNGLGNGSDQVGRNLMDHHKGVNINGTLEGLDEFYYSGKRPASLYIPRFRNIFNDKADDFVRGYHYFLSARRPRTAGDAMIGEELKEALSVPGKWQVSLGGYGECLPYADNRITLDKNKKDAFGLPQPVFDCSFKTNEKNMHKDMIERGKEMAEAAGLLNIKVSADMSAPGNANHEMGTARMGHDAKTSVLNAFNQMHEVPNVFITDGSCMTSSSYLNPSLTYMALTARACDYAVSELKKMNI
nr:GMC family oxidoreductase [uncultured Lacibacter sp.]